MSDFRARYHAEERWHGHRISAVSPEPAACGREHRNYMPVCIARPLVADVSAGVRYRR